MEIETIPAKRRLRLLIDSVTVSSPGMVNLQLELVRAAGASCPEDSDIVLLRSPGGPRISPIRKVSVVGCHEVGSSMWQRWKWYNRTLPEALRRYRADVLYSLSGILSPRISRNCAAISTVNNMLPFTPVQMQSMPSFSRRKLRLIVLRWQYVRSVRAANAMILHSHHALERVEEYAGGIRSKTLVVHTGKPSTVDFDPANPPPHPYSCRPYLIYFSSIYWYKNHLNLIEAYRRKLAGGVSLPDLILAGTPNDGAYLERINAALRAPELGGRAKYLGELPREALAAWLHHATVNVFPSTCETNSVVLAETLGVQGVLACSNLPPMPEICGDAAELFDPLDPDSIGDTMVMLCANPSRRDALRRAAARRSDDFSWDACGRAIWEAVPKAIADFGLRGANTSRVASS